MAGPWKLSALGVVALAATVSTSTLSTAYLMRPPVAPTILEPDAGDPPGPPRPAIVRITPVTPHRPVPRAPRRDACGAGGRQGSGAAAQAEKEARDTSARHGAPSCSAMAAESSAPAPAAP